jgi:hypothetical protein
MRKSSVRGMRFSVVKCAIGMKKNRHRWRFLEVLLDLVLLFA